MDQQKSYIFNTKRERNEMKNGIELLVCGPGILQLIDFNDLDSLSHRIIAWKRTTRTFCK